MNKSIVGIIAPAGYGKTEEIADAVNSCSEKQLILTHTRAGVIALKDRMKKKQVSNDKYEINTIASFCLKWCKAYPATANVKVPKTISEIDYLAIYRGARKIFSHNWAKEVLRHSYSGLFVDEYQDCTQSQHDIFMELKNVFPIRIFGDPLQGIFYWIKKDKIVNWNSFDFDVINPLTIPRRWEQTNEKLGALLDELRTKMLTVLDGNEVTINLANHEGCMTVLNSTQWDNGRFAYGINNYETVVYLSKNKHRQESFSHYSGGRFQCDEVKELKETETIISKIEEEQCEKKALVLLESLESMIVGIKAELSSYFNNLEKGRSDFSRIRRHREFGELIKAVCKENTAKSVTDVLRWFNKNTQFKIYRQELLYRVGKTYAYMAEENCSVHEAIEWLSGQQYFMEKRFSFSRLSSRMVLTKGLEFDCVIIDAREKLDARDFYVAMTRAKKYIYIISDRTQLSFDAIQY